MQRSLTIKNVFDKKFSTFEMEGVWQDVFGHPEDSGAWLVWGVEKAGKTWFSIMLANYLSSMTRVMYVSAEEGAGKAFQETCKRIGLQAGNRNMMVSEYISIEELDEKLSKRRAPRAVIIDNLTIYSDELKNGVLRRILLKHPGKLFVFLAHEERNEPYTATAKLVRKLAKVIIYIKGFTCTVGGRVPGGILEIDQERAQLYHKNQITNIN